MFPGCLLYLKDVVGKRSLGLYVRCAGILIYARRNRPLGRGTATFAAAS